jgi:hypothetical protein
MHQLEHNKTHCILHVGAKKYKLLRTRDRRGLLLCDVITEAWTGAY